MSPEMPRLARASSDIGHQTRAVGECDRKHDATKKCRRTVAMRKMNKRRGVLIRLIMFERAVRRGFAKNIIQSYQTTVLISLSSASPDFVAVRDL